MKKLLFLICFLPLALVSCDKDKVGEKRDLKVTSSEQGVIIGGEGREVYVEMTPTGGSFELNVETEAGWKLMTDQNDEWCAVVAGDNTVTVTAREFISDYTRKTMFKIVNDDDVTAFVTVSQDGTEKASMTLEPQQVAFDERGGTATVTVDSNKEDVEVTGHESADWLDVTVNGSEITLSAAANTVAEDLTAVLTVTAGTGDNTATGTITVTIDKWTPARIEPASDMAIAPADGGTVRMKINSNREWKAEESADWLTVSRDGDELVMTAEKNTSGQAKETDVTLSTTSGSDPLTVTITVKQFDDPMILEYTIPADNTTIAIPPCGTVNIYVDWGDGSTDTLQDEISPYSSNQLSHVYAKAGKYNIKIYGNTTLFQCGNAATMSNSRKYITAIVSWGNIGITDFTYGFTGTSIKSIPEGYEKAFAGATKFNYLFMHNTTLESIPADLFKGAPGATDISAAFFGCSSVKEIPAGLLDHFTGTVDLSSTFRGMGITSIPAGLFDSQKNVTSMLVCFAECASLKEVPEDLLKNCTKLKDVMGIFESCTSLETVPAGLFAHNPELTNVARIFQGCTSLKSVPVGLFDNATKITNLNFTFNGCTALKGSSPYTMVGTDKVRLWERGSYSQFTAPTSFIQCFGNCVGLDDYTEIPNNWKL